MPFQNLVTKHLNPADRSQLSLLMGQIETLLQPYMRNLDSEENKRVGRINEKGKLLVNKVQDYHGSQPALSSPDVDWAEYEADMESRKTYQQAATRLLAIAKSMTETRRLHDHDVYQNAIIDYQYAKYKNRTEPGLGYDSKVEDLKQFFPNGETRSLSDDI